MSFQACALLFDHSNCRDLKRDVPEGYTALGFRDRNDVESVLVSCCVSPALGSGSQFILCLSEGPRHKTDFTQSYLMFTVLQFLKSQLRLNALMLGLFE